MLLAAPLIPFPLGVYIGNADNSSAVNGATFLSNYTSFTALMGTAPQYIDTFIDQTQAVSSWIGNSNWAADSLAQSVAQSAIPVIALPLSSTVAGSATAQQQFQAFANGTYDAVLKGLVDTWAQRGFSNLVFRPGWEMNIEGSNYAGDTAASQGAWVKAFQHVYTVLHAEAAADGIAVQVVWNPSVTNYANVNAITNLYPGDTYVDIVGADIYSDLHPYSDGDNPATYHDWHTGAQDITVAQFIADPVNRVHYWSQPAATRWQSDSSGGHSLSFNTLLDFAAAHGKAFAVPETGAGNSSNGTDVSDDAAFPQWLSDQLLASKTSIAFVNLWNSNGGGNYEFSHVTDDKPMEAAAWAKYFGSRTTAASTLTVHLAEDAWNGDAQYALVVDGKTVIANAIVSVLHASGSSLAVQVPGTYAAGLHDVAVSFLNDAYGGTAATDRNLYVTGLDVNGVAKAGDTVTLLSTSTVHFTVSIPG